MSVHLPKLIATSVVRGSQQGESHGGVFTVDFESQEGTQHIDWNTEKIDWEGRGADRGLRGIAFDDDEIYIAASDELFVYDRGFQMLRSHKNRSLKHCHEISLAERRLFLTSTGFDSLLSFNLDEREFDWAFQLQKPYDQWGGFVYDPRKDLGPRLVNDFHINMVHVDRSGIYFSGLHTKGLLRLNDKMEVREVCSLPSGVHNARPWKDGIIFNDTASDAVRYVRRDGTEAVYAIHSYDESSIESAGVDDSKIARQGFGRGLTPFGDRFLAGGSSPSTISLYDIDANQKVGFVNLSMDIRNAIHGLEVWPFED